MYKTFVVILYCKQIILKVNSQQRMGPKKSKKKKAKAPQEMMTQPSIKEMTSQQQVEGQQDKRQENNFKSAMEVETDGKSPLTKPSTRSTMAESNLNFTGQRVNQELSTKKSSNNIMEIKSHKNRENILLRDPIGEDNDFINMSSINILAAKHPTLTKNLQIIRQYNPNIPTPKTDDHNDEEGSRPQTHMGGYTKGGKLSNPMITKKPGKVPSQENFKSKQFFANRNQETTYNSFLDGQLYEAKSRLDNFSQADSFFRAVNNNLMFAAQRKSKGFQRATKPKKKFQDISPFSMRKSLLGFANLPQPSKKTLKTINENVYQQHYDSSDEEVIGDKTFLDQSYDITHKLISDLTNDQIAEISENFHHGIQNGMQSVGRATFHNSRNGEKTLPSISTFVAPGAPATVSPAPGGHDFSNSSPYQHPHTKLFYSQSRSKPLEAHYRSMHSRSTIQKLVRGRNFANNRQLDLLGQPITEEEYISDEEKANQRRVGLPQIKKFYQKYKQLGKLKQLDAFENNAQVAYMNTAEKLPVVPVPIGVVSKKGTDKEINLHDQSIGNNYGLALAEMMKYSKAENLQLANNRLNAKVIMSILENMNNNIKEINLSDNNLSDKEHYIQKRLQKLQVQRDYPKNANKYNLKYYYSPNKRNKADQIRSTNVSPSVIKEKEKGKEKEKEKEDLGADGQPKKLHNTIGETENLPTQSDDEDRPPQSIDILCSHLEDQHKYNIMAIYLNRCKLTDKEAVKLVDSIVQISNTKIKKIYLNQNELSDKTALRFAHMIQEGNTKVKEIGLKWNKITAVGGNKIAEGLCENIELKLLDLSWNSIGVKPAGSRNPLTGQDKEIMKVGEIGAIWGRAMKQNETLVHVDISYNKIDQHETVLISQDLRFNNTCVGFHYTGNAGINPAEPDKIMGKIDSLGFMKLIDSLHQSTQAMHLGLRLPDGSPLKQRKFNYQMSRQDKQKLASYNRVFSPECRNSNMSTYSRSRLMLPSKQMNAINLNYHQKQINLENKNRLQNFVMPVKKLENCWLCEKWVECEFKINFPEMMKQQHNIDVQMTDDLDTNYLVFIHFDFDDFEPDRMTDLRFQSIELKGQYQVYRMVPQGKYHYFFTYNNIPFYDGASEISKVSSTLQMEIHEMLTTDAENFRHELNIKDFELPYINQVNTLMMIPQKAQEIFEIEKQEKRAERDSDCSGTVSDEEMRSDEYGELQSQYYEDQSPSLIGRGNRNNVSNDSRPPDFGQTPNSGMRSKLISLPMNNMQEKSSMDIGGGYFQNFQSAQRSKANNLKDSLNSDMNNGSQQSDKSFNLNEDQFSQFLQNIKKPSTIPEFKTIDEETYTLRFKHCIIRQDKSLNAQAKVDTPWTIDVGLFKPYVKEENKKLINDCFDFDWDKMKQFKFKNSDPDEVKDEMRKVYPLLKNCYKYYAGINPSNNVFSITANFTDQMMNETLDCIDHHESGKLQIKDTGRMFITVNSKVALQNNPAQALVRYQLVEFIIRCAIEKFLVAGTVDSAIKAIKMFNENFIIPKIGVDFDETQWRRKVTFNVYVDNVLKAYKPLLDRVYNRYSGKHKMPGEKSFMMADEFTTFMTDSGLQNDLLAVREATIIFNLSMFTQVDELTKVRHLRAQPLEFLEMICRCAEMSSYPPPPQEGPDGELIEKQMTVEQRKAQPLSVKIENCLPTVFANCIEKKHLNSFAYPKKDAKRNLYILPNGKFF